MTVRPPEKAGARSGQAPPSGPGAAPRRSPSRQPAWHSPRRRRGRRGRSDPYFRGGSRNPRGSRTSCPGRKIRCPTQLNFRRGSLHWSPSLVATCEKLLSPPLSVFLLWELGPEGLVLHINSWFLQLSRSFSQTAV